MYQAPVSDLNILHAQVEAKSHNMGGSSDAVSKSEILLPPFLEVDRLLEQTKEDETLYGAYSLSLISTRSDTTPHT